MKSKEQPVLKRCPFCGGNGELREIDYGTAFKAECAIFCDNCNAMTDWTEDRSEVIELWERRV